MGRAVLNVGAGARATEKVLRVKLKLLIHRTSAALLAAKVRLLHSIISANRTQALAENDTIEISR